MNTAVTVTGIEYHVYDLPIERLFRSEAFTVVRSYNALMRQGVTTIGELIRRRNDVPNMRGIGVASWNTIIGCMMDFDTAHGTNIEAQFTDSEA